eukprot:6128971-Prymnesium_polylepis.1
MPCRFFSEDHFGLCAVLLTSPGRDTSRAVRNRAGSHERTNTDRAVHPSPGGGAGLGRAGASARTARTRPRSPPCPGFLPFFLFSLLLQWPCTNRVAESGSEP